MPRQHIESKAHRYIDKSDGLIRAVIILDVRYPDMKKAWVSLLTADGWVQYRELVHDADLDEQPVGQVDLYLSDFVDPVDLPLSYCRPSAAERDAGITRFDLIPPLPPLVVHDETELSHADLTFFL